MKGFREVTSEYTLQEEQPHSADQVGTACNVSASKSHVVWPEYRGRRQGDKGGLQVGYKGSES